MGGQHQAPAALRTGKRPGTHCTGGWVGPRAGILCNIRNNRMYGCYVFVTVLFVYQFLFMGTVLL